MPEKGSTTQSHFMTNPFTENTKLHNALHYSIALIAGVISVWLAYSYIMHTWIIWDGSFYLLMARLFYENGNIYHDMTSAYTPLGAMIFSLPWYFTAEPSYRVFHIMQHVFVLLSGIMAYKILAGKFSSSLALAAGATMILIILTIGTKDLKLEPIYLFFLLVSFYFLIYARHKKDYLLTGIFFTLAWFSKQFALLALPPILIFLWQNRKTAEHENHFRYFFSGILITFLAFYGYFVVFAGVPAEHFTSIVLGLSDHTDYGRTGLSYTPHGAIIYSFQKMIRFIPLVIPIVILFIRNWINEKQYRSYDARFLFFLAAVFSLAKLAIAHNSHYYIPIFSFFFLFMVSEAARATGKNSTISRMVLPRILRKHLYLIFLFLVFAPPLLYGARSLNYHLKNKENHIQANLSYLQTAEKISKIVPFDALAMVDGNQAFTFLCRLKPAHPEKLPAGFAMNYKSETIQRYMLPGAYLIVEENLLARYTILTDSNFKFVGKADDHLIFQKVGSAGGD